MVHVSKMAPYRVGSPADFLKAGDVVTVKIDEIDEKGRVNLTMKDCPENAHLWVDKKANKPASSAAASARAQAW